MTEGLKGDIEQYINSPEAEGSEQEKLDKYSTDARKVIHESPEWQEAKDRSAEDIATPEKTVLMDENLMKLKEFVSRHNGDVSDGMIDRYSELGEELLQLGDALTGRRFANLSESEKQENFERLKAVISDVRELIDKVQQSQEEIISFRQALTQYSSDNIESELDKNFIKFAYDRLGNDVSKFDFQSFKPGFDSEKPVSEVLENIDITDWRAEEVLSEHLEDFIKDVNNSIYQYVKFIKCLEKMVNNKEKILKNKGDIAYGRDAMRNTAYGYESEEINELEKTLLGKSKSELLEKTNSYLQMYSNRGMDIRILSQLNDFLQSTSEEELDKGALKKFFEDLNLKALEMKEPWEKKLDSLQPHTEIEEDYE